MVVVLPEPPPAGPAVAPPEAGLPVVVVLEEGPPDVGPPEVVLAGPLVVGVRPLVDVVGPPEEEPPEVVLAGPLLTTVGAGSGTMQSESRSKQRPSARYQ